MMQIIEINEVGQFNPEVKEIMGQLMAMYISDGCLCRPKHAYFRIVYTQKGDLLAISLDYDRGGNRSFSYAEWISGSITRYGFCWY